MSRQEIRNRLLHYQQEAKAQAEKACALISDFKIRENSPDSVLAYICEEYTRHVHRYVCAKFYLPATSDPERLLIHLAQDSIEEAIQMKIPFAKESETATTCGAAGSSAVKVALLMVAIQKDFQVTLAPAKLAFVKNTIELGSLLFQTASHSIPFHQR